MATTITAGNATNGAIISPDNTGILEFKTGSGAGTTALTLGTGQQVAYALGAAAAPSITFSGDTNTGIFSPAADTIAFTEGGVESMRIDGSGNVGIGTSSPGTRLDVAGNGRIGNAGGTFQGLTLQNNNNSASAETISFLDTTNNLGTIDANLFFGHQTDGGSYVSLGTTPPGSRSSDRRVERMRIDSSGNVGIGTSSPGVSLDVAGRASTFIRVGSTQPSSLYLNNAGTYSFIYTQEALPLLFGTAAAERARIDASGNFMVGQTTLSATTVGFGVNPAGLVNIAQNNSTSGGTGIQIYSTAASAFRFFVTMDGRVNATNTTILAISDIRLKENIQDIDVGLDAVMALKPRKFDWKEGKGKDIKGDRGWIAQEFEQVFPDMVGTWRDEPPEGEEPYKSVGADLIPVLVKAIQEQQAMIDELKAELDALKGAA